MDSVKRSCEISTNGRPWCLLSSISLSKHSSNSLFHRAVLISPPILKYFDFQLTQKTVGYFRVVVYKY